jgi:wobble nucleotide-excising tRNase
MAKLEDVHTNDNNPIIWIDDPISSLDGNHIFFIFSLIASKIVKQGKFKQLFISTHNLDFLKYLKRLPDKTNLDPSQTLERAYFILERTEQYSQIKAMPTYLKAYVTEFNYLFHQIYKCAKADVYSEENHDCFYNYANNARKFLEAFLYYKYPNANEKDKTKLERFFADSISQISVDRFNNEYSHLAEIFDRSITPIDIPEIKKQAQFILYKIK